MPERESGIALITDFLRDRKCFGGVRTGAGQVDPGRGLRIRRKAAASPERVSDAEIGMDDRNGNGRIDVRDAVLLLRAALGIG